MATPAVEKFSLRTQGAIYGVGMFSSTMSHISGLLVPLWLVTLEPSPFLIGVVLGSRSVLPLLLSIHGGALMDRLGVRRVTLFFAIMATVTPLFYPLAPWIPVVILLQMMHGLSASMGWIGAQTTIGHVMKGNPTYAGRLSFSLRIGNFLGPPLVGYVWDQFGAWGAFGMLALWGAGMWVSAMMLPATAGESTGSGPVARRDLMPRLSDHIETFRLLVIPAVLLVVMVSVLRISGAAIQSSFYVVYLESIKFTGAEIGLLWSAAAVLGGVGALGVGPATRIFIPHWLLIVMVAGATILIAITPLLGSVSLLLLLASALRGGTLGLSQPLMVSILLKSAGPGAQGKSVGLRTTANRAAQTILPVLMGAIAEMVGIANSFYVIGGVLLILVGLVAIYTWRSPSLGSGAGPGTA
ncbi:MAG: MFS transporter [Alphaproteobacteria bacterium]